MRIVIFKEPVSHTPASTHPCHLVIAFILCSINWIPIKTAWTNESLRNFITTSKTKWERSGRSCAVSQRLAYGVLNPTLPDPKQTWMLVLSLCSQSVALRHDSTAKWNIKGHYNVILNQTQTLNNDTPLTMVQFNPLPPTLPQASPLPPSFIGPHYHRCSEANTTVFNCFFNGSY